MNILEIIGAGTLVCTGLMLVFVALCMRQCWR